MFESASRALPTVCRLGALLTVLIGASPLAAQTGVAPTVASLRGSVGDSIRNGVLAGAYVELQPGARQTITNELGEFHFDSLPPATGYVIRVVHPMLDTIGIALTTPAFTLAAGDAKRITLAVPSATRLVSMFCPPEMLARGPSALIGFVRDPDSGAPIDSVTVSLVYDDGAAGLIKRPVNRVTKLDAAGRYKICGLPAQMNGRVQLIRNRTQSADIPVSTDPKSPLALRSLGMSLATQHVSRGTDSSGKPVRVLKGSAKVTGRVLSKSGTPIAGARVQMDETAAAAVTGNDGRFTLDSVPTGTQTISVRKLGYTVTDKAVEVSMADPSPVAVVMENYIPTLAPIVSVAQADQDKERIGFTRRKRQGLGLFRDAADLPRDAHSLGTMLSTIPGIQVGHDPSNPNQDLTITAVGGPSACMTFIVDGVLWRQDPDAGNIGDFVRPDELQAIELYSPSTVPSEFAVSPQQSCKVLVLWTARKIRPGYAKPAKPPAF